MRWTVGFALAVLTLAAASACTNSAPAADAAAPANSITTAVNAAEATANQAGGR